MSLSAHLKKKRKPKHAPAKKHKHAHKRKKTHHKKKKHPVVHHTTTPPKVPPPQPPPKPPVDPPTDGPLPVYHGDAGHPELKRLLWRAGFGPRRGDIDAMSGMSLQDAVYSLTRPSGAAVLNGPEPHDDNGPLAPYDSWGHDHLWWLDRMVRSNQQLVERMTLIWHDWFATSNDAVGNQRLMLGQNETFRANALGSFRDLVRAVTQDPAMLLWLNGIDNRRGAANENYARELMELFTLGADRGAYTETDVRQLALCLTGFRADWVDGPGWTNFRYDPNRHDTTTKTVFGQSGNFDWQAAVDLVLQNSYHASFFVTKLWSYFVPTPPDAGTQAALQQLYTSSGYAIRPVVEAILMHPDFYNGQAMVKPPVVYTAGLLRTFGRYVDIGDWAWLDSEAGQQLFYPPNVAGWNDSAWLDTSRWRGRWYIAASALYDRVIDPWNGTHYDIHETPEAALTQALGFFNNPAITAGSQDTLLSFSRSCLPEPMQSWQMSPFRAMRQNALRHLIATSPDFHTC